MAKEKEKPKEEEKDMSKEQEQKPKEETPKVFRGTLGFGAALDKMTKKK